MADIINIQDFTGRKSAERVFGEITGLYAKAKLVIEEFNSFMENDPVSGIKMLPEFVEKIRNVNPEPGYESLAGGPNTDWTGPILNILGAYYPTLDRTVRKQGLILAMDFLDRLSYDQSQDHVELVHEPWLAGDIILTRPLYYPGYSECIDLLKECSKWPEFVKNSHKIRSAFFMALAITRPEYSSLEIRTKFYKTHPELVDRTLDFIAALSFYKSRKFMEEEKIPEEAAVTKSLLHYDPLLHDNIQKKVKDHNWIRLSEELN